MSLARFLDRTHIPNDLDTFSQQVSYSERTRFLGSGLILCILAAFPEHRPYHFAVSLSVSGCFSARLTVASLLFPERLSE